MFVNYYYTKDFKPHIYILNKSHGIEASYITVHSYDILVINIHPQLYLITKISYSL